MKIYKFRVMLSHRVTAKNEHDARDLLCTILRKANIEFSTIDDVILLSSMTHPSSINFCGESEAIK